MIYYLEVGIDARSQDYYLSYWKMKWILYMNENQHNIMLDETISNFIGLRKLESEIKSIIIFMDLTKEYYSFVNWYNGTIYTSYWAYSTR